VLKASRRQILIRTSECFPSSDILQDYLFSRWVMPFGFGGSQSTGTAIALSVSPWEKTATPSPRHSGFVGRGDKLRVCWFLGLYPFKNQHLNIKQVLKDGVSTHFSDEKTKNILHISSFFSYFILLAETAMLPHVLPQSGILWN